MPPARFKPDLTLFRSDLTQGGTNWNMIWTIMIQLTKLLLEDTHEKS